MKALRITWFFIKWIFYFLFTLDARNRFMEGEFKGMNCYKTDQGLFGHTSYYDPKTAPTREYITFSQFKSKYFPV